MRQRVRLPDFVRARRRLYGLGVVLLAAGITLIMIARDPLQIPVWVLVLLWTAYAAGLISLFMWLNGEGARAYRRFRRGELPCWGCAYDLSHIEAERRCPECGRGFDAETLHSAWAALRSTYRPGPD